MMRKQIFLDDNNENANVKLNIANEQEVKQCEIPEILFYEQA